MIAPCKNFIPRSDSFGIQRPVNYLQDITRAKTPNVKRFVDPWFGLSYFINSLLGCLRRFIARERLSGQVSWIEVPSQAWSSPAGQQDDANSRRGCRYALRNRKAIWFSDHRSHLLFSPLPLPVPRRVGGAASCVRAGASDRYDVTARRKRKPVWEKRPDPRHVPLLRPYPARCPRSHRVASVNNIDIKILTRIYWISLIHLR